MSTSGKSGYHHGDLRAALLEAAVQMLEQGEPFSMRAVARRAGVSPTAPYRHFADREALESAVAVEGFHDLKAALTEGRDAPSSATDLAENAVTYVSFALSRPAVFRLMFGNECDDTNDQRVQAAAELHELLAGAVGNVFPDADAPTLGTALWSLAHGLAFLHLDGKFAAASPEEVAARVRSAFDAVLAIPRIAGGATGDAD
ncbi:MULTISPECIES: TetR/AcrR family transcriptional regulator [Prauserella salsuginis group]|uniref:TetR/AcrR family transcriptional regulator n=1 Tax=Prauserella salsuginis TaxID=387889 RepID=A0ABW6G004_9PSEU|nr:MULTISPECIES: TetR/AcrR family transcriptional regulator [Prauserella salsuginis group]MCR3721151.1 transcriptional regulator, TetR family [Prauserella flava]MCR3734769.1 transcriptional regulator, TetR family [Prauserella salsuginis]